MNLIPADSPQTTPGALRRFRAAALRALRGQPRDDQPASMQMHISPQTIKRAFIALEIVLLLGLAGVLALTITMRRAMRAALPQLDGTISVAGLRDPVTVTRDPQGVPAITAKNLDDLLFAQGYVTAQDRLWQMDALRRHAAGDMAEILGSPLVEHDRIQRTLQLRTAAERALTALPADQMHQLEAYARGVNAFIDTHREARPVEFHLLHYAPAPWSPRDSLLVLLAMAQDLSSSFPQKLNREGFSQHLPASLLGDLYPAVSWRDRPPTQAALDLTAPTESIEQIPLDKTQAESEFPTASPHELLRTFNALGGGRCDGCRAGSNNWAVAGSRSASGAPLVSNDMHLGLTAPDIWYEASLHAASTPTNGPLDVAGVTLPGIPFVIVGRNAHVAWGLTNTGADVQDLRIEHLRTTNGQTEFARLDDAGGTTWTPAIHRVEAIHVRGGRDVVLDVLNTTHSVGNFTMETPVISPLHPSEKRALSLAWNIYDPANLTMPFLDLNTASDGASLVAAAGGFGVPSLSMVYADAQHIGFHVLGRVPIRGPATQRPRATQPFVMPDRTPESDEEDEQDKPAASLSMPPQAAHTSQAAHIIRAAWAQNEIATKPTTSYTIGSPIAYFPVDALDRSQAWSGYVPYNELPAVLDPEGGVVATANARVTTDDYPYYLNGNWADPYRVERIDKLLANRTGLRPADMLTIETDVHSELDLLVAQRLAYALDHASSSEIKSDKRLRQAADLLRDWRGDVSPDSAAAAIVATTRSALWLALLVPQIEKHDAATARPGHKPPSAMDVTTLYTWNERTSAMESLLLHEPARWLPPGVANWNDLLASAVASALKSNHAPADLTTWRYGAVHTVEIAHPVLGSGGPASWLLGLHTGTGPQPTGGDGTTIKQTGQHFGPSERFTADLADTEATTLNITTGQSGNPASPWFLDQFLPWLRGSTFSLPLHRPAVAHTLLLKPH